MLLDSCNCLAQTNGLSWPAEVDGRLSGEMMPEMPTTPDAAITTWFLVLGLFLPRVTLVAAYLTHTIPPNNVPFILDMLGAIFLPRVLICIYIAYNMGYNEWFWLHLAIALAVYAFSSSKGKKALRRKD
jgi:hypothetical protein